MKRRHFLQTTLASAIGIPAFALDDNNAYRKNIGIQLYTLRNEIKEDVAGTLKAVADAGYKQVEPYGFPNAGEMIAAAKDNGLAVNSSHFAWESVTDPEKKGVPKFTDILEKAKNCHVAAPHEVRFTVQECLSGIGIELERSHSKAGNVMVSRCSHLQFI